jgi:hypothetical protein
VFGSALNGSGRTYSTPVSLLPGGRGDGQPITTLIDLESGTQPAHYFAGHTAQVLLLTNSGGYGLLAKVGDLVARQRGGKAFLTLEAGEQPLPPALASAGGLDDQVACLSANGRLLVFPLSDLKLQPNGGRGLTLMDLEPPDSLASVAVFSQALRIEGTGRGGKARDELLKGASLAVYLSKRARKHGQVVEDVWCGRDGKCKDGNCKGGNGAGGTRLRPARRSRPIGNSKDQPGLAPEGVVTDGPCVFAGAAIGNVTLADRGGRWRGADPVAHDRRRAETMRHDGDRVALADQVADAELLAGVGDAKARKEGDEGEEGVPHAADVARVCVTRAARRQ